MSINKVPSLPYTLNLLSVYIVIYTLSIYHIIPKFSFKIFVIGKHQLTFTLSLVISKLTSVKIINTFIFEPEIAYFIHIVIIICMVQILLLLIIHFSKTLSNIMLPLSIKDKLLFGIKKFALIFHISFLPITNIFPTIRIDHPTITMSFTIELHTFIDSSIIILSIYLLCFRLLS
jgi:hypothetical protein